jgi:hypothetical protein
MQIVSDDVVHLARDAGNGGLLLWGNPWLLRLLPETRTLFPELESIALAKRRNGELYLGVDVSKHFQGASRVSCRPSLLLFLVRNGRGTSAATPLSSNLVLERLQKDIVLDTLDVVERHDALLGQLAQLRAYRLEVGGHPSLATDLIKALAS